MVDAYETRFSSCDFLHTKLNKEFMEGILDKMTGKYYIATGKYVHIFVFYFGRLYGKM